MSFLLGRKKAEESAGQAENAAHSNADQEHNEGGGSGFFLARTVSTPDLSKYDKVETQNNRVCDFLPHHHMMLVTSQNEHLHSGT